MVQTLWYKQYYIRKLLFGHFDTNNIISANCVSVPWYKQFYISCGSIILIQTTLDQQTVVQSRWYQQYYINALWPSHFDTNNITSANCSSVTFIQMISYQQTVIQWTVVSCSFAPPPNPIPSPSPPLCSPHSLSWPCQVEWVVVIDLVIFNEFSSLFMN